RAAASVSDRRPRSADVGRAEQPSEPARREERERAGVLDGVDERHSRSGKPAKLWKEERTQLDPVEAGRPEIGANVGGVVQPRSSTLSPASSRGPSVTMTLARRAA